MCYRCFQRKQYEKEHPVAGRALRWAGPVSFAILASPILVPAALMIAAFCGPITGVCYLVSWIVEKWNRRPQLPEES